MLRLATTRAARHLTRQAAPACYAGAVRGYAAGGDIVKDVFVDQQKKFRALMDATKDLEVPVGGDRAAIKAYAEQRKAIMAKVRARFPSLGVPRASRRPRITGPMPPRTGPFARECLLGHHLGFFFASRTRGCWRAIGGGTPRVAPETASAPSRSVARTTGDTPGAPVARHPARVPPRKPSPPLCPKRTSRLG